MEPASYLPGKYTTCKKYTKSSLQIVKKKKGHVLVLYNSKQELNEGLEYHSQDAPIFLVVDLQIFYIKVFPTNISCSSQGLSSIFTLLISQRCSASTNQIFTVPCGGLR